MKRPNLKDVTLVIIDCGDYERAKKSLEVSSFYANYGDIKFFADFDKDDVIKTPEIDYVGYQYFKSFEINKYIDTDFFINSEWDGFGLSSNWSDEFLKYDYVGAPWHWCAGHMDIGCGGFSLRSKKLLETMDSDERLKHSLMNLDFVADDVFTCRIQRPYLELVHGIKYAPRHVGSKWCAEGVVWDGQFGFHDFAYTDITKWGDSSLFDMEYVSDKNFIEYTRTGKVYFQQLKYLGI